MKDDQLITEIKKGKTIKKKNKITRTMKKNNEIKKKKILFVTKIISIVLIVFILIVIAFCTNVFSIKKIEVSGNTKLSENKIISISMLNYETHILKFNKKVVEEALCSNPYIEKAKISRKLPSTVSIEIIERTPEYMLQFADSYVYIDNKGYMLEVTNEKLDIPVIVGFSVDLNNIKAGNRLDNSDLEKLNVVMKIYETAKNVEISNYITKMDVSNLKENKIILEDLSKTVYIGDVSNLNSKMLELKEILNKTQNRSGTIYLNVDLKTQKAYFRQDID